MDEKTTGGDAKELRGQHIRRKIPVYIRNYHRNGVAENNSEPGVKSPRKEEKNLKSIDDDSKAGLLGK